MNFSSWLNKRFHPSYGLGWLAVGLLIGLGAASSWSYIFPGWLLVLLIAATIMLLINRRLMAYLILVLVAITIGWWRGSTVDYQLQDLKNTIGQTIAINGVVLEDPSLSDRGDTRVVIGQISLDGRPVRGQIWATLSGDMEVGRGDWLSLVDEAKSGFGPYSIAMSFPEIKQHQIVKSPIRLLREAFTANVRQFIVDPAASLGLGFVIGQRSSLPNQLDDQLRAVGLTHMIVASGYNLTILVRFAKRTLEKKSKYLTAAVSVGLMVGFIAVSGASPSMVRAGLVTGLTVLAWYYGRKFHPLLLIVYAMAITAVYEPMYLWADIGWWLSFLAFAGVLIVSPLMARWLYRHRNQPGSIVQIAIETSAAQVMTLPLIMLTFGQLPLLSVVANILAAPFVPLAMLLTFVAGLAGMVLPGLAAAIALPAEIILSYFIALVEFLASPQWALVDIGLNVYGMLASFAVIIIVVLYMWRKFNFNFRSTSVID